MTLERAAVQLPVRSSWPVLTKISTRFRLSSGAVLVLLRVRGGSHSLVCPSLVPGACMGEFCIPLEHVVLGYRAQD